MNHATPAIQADTLEHFLPPEVWPLTDHQTDLPRIARDPKLTSAIAVRLREIPTTHDLYCHDARDMTFVPNESVRRRSLTIAPAAVWCKRDVGRLPKKYCFVMPSQEIWIRPLPRDSWHRDRCSA